MALESDLEMSRVMMTAMIVTTIEVVLCSEDRLDGRLDCVVPCQCCHETERRRDEGGEGLQKLDLELVRFLRHECK